MQWPVAILGFVALALPNAIMVAQESARLRRSLDTPLCQVIVATAYASAVGVFLGLLAIGARAGNIVVERTCFVIAAILGLAIMGLTGWATLLLARRSLAEIGRRFKQALSPRH